jgi:nucleotide-binding universal stress UspA family protein
MSVAIDDFGTGHSGLMQIVGLNFDILKIDHSLIETILTDQTAARMLRGIVHSPPRCDCIPWLRGSNPGMRLFFFAPPASIAVKAGFGARPCQRRTLRGYWKRDILVRWFMDSAQNNLERSCNMSQSTQTVQFVKSIFHPSDFSAPSESAFAHALAIALIRKTTLVIMHARRGEREDWSKFPAVRKTLSRWQVLEPGSRSFDVFQSLGVAVTKVSTRGDPVGVSMRQIQRQKPDLVVLATRGSHGLPLWLKPSVAQAIARRTEAMTLFVPRGCRGIVSVDGVIRLRRILLPIDHQTPRRR